MKIKRINKLISKKDSKFNNDYNQIINFMGWLSNYSPNFIEEIWDEEWLIEHLKNKFNKYVDIYEGYNIILNFYISLDLENRYKLIDWVTKNYKFR